MQLSRFSWADPNRKCPLCKSSSNVVRFGVSSGRQRYKCKQCGKSFVNPARKSILEKKILNDYIHENLTVDYLSEVYALSSSTIFRILHRADLETSIDLSLLSPQEKAQITTIIMDMTYFGKDCGYLVVIDAHRNTPLYFKQISRSERNEDYFEAINHLLENEVYPKACVIDGRIGVQKYLEKLGILTQYCLFHVTLHARKVLGSSRKMPAMYELRKIIDKLAQSENYSTRYDFEPALKRWKVNYGRWIDEEVASGPVSTSLSGFTPEPVSEPVSGLLSKPSFRSVSNPVSKPEKLVLTVTNKSRITTRRNLKNPLPDLVLIDLSSISGGILVAPSAKATNKNRRAVSYIMNPFPNHGAICEFEHYRLLQLEFEKLRRKQEYNRKQEAIEKERLELAKNSAILQSPSQTSAQSSAPSASLSENDFNQLNKSARKTKYSHTRIRNYYYKLEIKYPYFFTYLEHPELKIPRTQSKIEGLFGNVKDQLRAHKGISNDFRKGILLAILKKCCAEMKEFDEAKFVAEILSSKSNAKNSATSCSKSVSSTAVNTSHSIASRPPVNLRLF